jgi:hypothetical protein
MDNNNYTNINTTIWPNNETLYEGEMMKKIYQFDSSGFYSGSSECLEGQLLPNSTDKAPPTASGKIARWGMGEWVLVPVSDQVKEQVPTVPLQPPSLVITGITSSVPATTLVDLIAGEVTCPQGSTLTATVEIRNAAGVIILLSASFRMPVKARDGREVVALATFVDGVATIVIPFTQSGVWLITEQAINSALPPEGHMSFSGLTVYVVV